MRPEDVVAGQDSPRGDDVGDAGEVRIAGTNCEWKISGGGGGGGGGGGRTNCGGGGGGAGTRVGILA